MLGPIGYTFIDDQLSIADASTSLEYVTQSLEAANAESSNSEIKYKLHITVIYKGELYEAITCEFYSKSTKNSQKFEEVKDLGSADEYTDELFKNLKTGTIRFFNSTYKITASDILVDMYAYVEDPILQKRIEDGTYFIVSSLNDADKLTMLTSPVTTQTATKNGDVIYACLTDGKGNYVAAASETISNIDKTEYTVAYSLNGGKITGQKTTYNVDDSFTLPTPTKEGYTFAGWTENNGATAKISVIVPKGSTGNKQYTANWDSGSTAAARKTTDYTQCYADIDGDGIVDGLIFADLAFSCSGKWEDSSWSDSYDLSFSYSAVTSGLKSYYISNNLYSDPIWGDHEVISPINGTNGADRFYIMSLTDFDSNTHCWYCSAKGQMNDYSTFTSEAFGKGKENTTNMITAWNNKKYGEQGYTDLWGIIQDKVNAGWFVPSKDEWSAFAKNCGITDNNHSSFGLKTGYWLSSQANDNSAWYASFYRNHYSLYYNTSYDYYVRLATTF